MSSPKILLSHIHGLFARVMVFENAGDVEQGHTHQFDHATLVAHGSVLVRAKGRETVFKAPHLIWIAKDINHELVAQEPGTVCACLHTTDSAKFGPSELEEIVSEDMVPAGAEESFAKRHTAA